jgi:methylase of polypeptide subunit release factors
MWTRAQAHWAVELHPMLPDGPFLELCCGVGHIGLLAARDTGRRALLVDASAAACEHALLAVRAAGLEERVRVLHHHIDGAPLPGTAARSAALVLIDPPYLSTLQLREAAGDPRHAVDGGHDGLKWVEPMLRTASHHLADGGVCLLQVRGRRQADHIVRAQLDLLVELGLRTWALRTVDERRAVLLLCDEAVDERGIPGGVRG